MQHPPNPKAQVRNWLHPLWSSLIDSDLICIICYEPLLDPVVVVEPKCGQMFCRRCLDMWCQKDKSCPQCKRNLGIFRHLSVVVTTLPTDKQKVVSPPRMINNALDRLLAICPACFGHFERKALPDHIPYSLSVQNVSRSPKRMPFLLNNAIAFVAPVDEMGHDAFCTEKLVTCPAADVGCDHQCVRCLLSQHTATCSIFPLRAILLKQQDMEKQLKECRARIQQLEDVEAKVLILQQAEAEKALRKRDGR